MAKKQSRQPGAVRPCAPIKTRHRLNWRDPISGRSVQMLITHESDCLVAGQDDIEIESLQPVRAPLPIAITGYGSHFISDIEIAKVGSVKTFVSRWLDSTAKSVAWRRTQACIAQGDLFQRADVQREIAKETTRSRRPTSRPRTKPRKDCDPA